MPTPTPAALRDLVDRYCAAVTAGDIDAVVALFTPDATQRDPANTPPNVGHAAIRTFFESAASASQSMRFEAPRVHTCGAQVAFDFVVTVTLDGATMVISGVEVFAVTDDLLISEVSAYWDESDVVMA